MSRKTGIVFTSMIGVTGAIAVFSGLFFILHGYCEKPWMLSAAITLLTVCYHLAMRLLVGEVVTVIFKNREFPQDRLGFPIHMFEPDLYEKLNVKLWKGNVITAKPEQFDIRICKPEELLHNVMQAELVHRIIAILSFVPLAFIIPFGTPLVFVLTSVAACLIDLQFAVIQRYNRPRVIRYMDIMDRRKRRKEQAWQTD